MSHPSPPPPGLTYHPPLEPLICIASCCVMGKLFQPVRRAQGDRAERLMQVTRALETLSGVHLAAGVFDAAHVGRGHGRGRVLARCAFVP